MARISDLAEVKAILGRTRSIAVLGASPIPSRAGHYVGQYLAVVGYELWAVNPMLAGQTLWGRPVVATLADLPGPVDMIDVFRRPETLPGHTDEILALPWKPKTVWFQLMVWDPPSAESLAAAGIDVVENRCTMADHQRFS